MAIKRWIKNIFAEKKVSNPIPDFERELITTDKNGHRWYRYKDPLNMPVSRMIDIQRASETAALTLTKAELIEYIEKIEEVVMKNKKMEELHRDLYPLLSIFKTRAAVALERNTLTELAACYFLMDDEPYQTYDYTMGEVKKQYWVDNPELGDFFLQLAVIHTVNSTELLQKNLTAYLVESQKTIKELTYRYKTAYR